jgi:hypothetical protein
MIIYTSMLHRTSSQFIFLLIFLAGISTTVNAQIKCKAIEATAEVIYSPTGSGSVSIQFRGESPSLFTIYLVGPKGYFNKEIKDDLISGLEKGNYTLIFTPVSEKDNFCLKHVELAVK